MTGTNASTPAADDSRIVSLDPSMFGQDGERRPADVANIADSFRNFSEGVADLAVNRDGQVISSDKLSQSDQRKVNMLTEMMHSF